MRHCARRQTAEAFPVVTVESRLKSASTSNKVTEGASNYKSKGVSEVDGVKETKSKGPTMQAILGAITVLIIGFFVGKYARNSRKDMKHAWTRRSLLDLYYCIYY